MPLDTLLSFVRTNSTPSSVQPPQTDGSSLQEAPLPPPSEPSGLDPSNLAVGFDLPDSTPVPTAGSSFSLMPATAAAVAKASTDLERTHLDVEAHGASVPSLLTRLGARPGVHFDFESGIPFLSRLASEREPTDKEKMAALEHEYGKENVRKNSFGQAVVTTTDERGKTVDKLANPLGLDIGDLSTFMAQSPEMLGWLVPTVLTGGAGALRAIGTLGLSALGGELSGAAKDLFLRWREGRPAEPAEIAGRRTINAGVNFVSGGVLGGLSKLEALRVSPFNTAGRLQFNSKAAAQYLNEKFGGSLEQTAAQATGSQLLQAAEGLEAAKPGSRSAFAAFKGKQLEEINRLKDIATGSIPDEEAAGKSVLEAAKNKLAPLEYDIQLAAQEAEDAARKTIVSAAGARADKTAIGESIDTRAKAIRDAFEQQNEKNYAAFDNHPLAKQPIVPTVGLESEVNSFLADLPKVQQTIQVPSPVLGPTGAPQLTTITKNVPVETPVRPKLEEFSRKLANGTVSIYDLKQMRTDVNNAVQGGLALTGVKDGRLEHLGGMLTRAIDGGLMKINDPALTAAWDNAKNAYAQGITKFEKAGIAELFRDPVNAIGPTELVDRAARSADTYAAYKEFFGANSPQIKGVQKAVRDNVFDLGSIGKTVDAPSFAARLDDLDRQSPKLLEDAFGVSQAAFLRSQAKGLMAAQGQSIPKDELAAAMASGSLTGQKLSEMMAAQARRDTAYSNGLIKDISTGTIKPEKIQPTEVVDKFVFRSSTQPEHLAELVDQLGDSPATLESLRRLTFKRALDDATVTNKRTGERELSADKLAAMFRDQNLDKKLQTVLGDESYNDLVAFKDFLIPSDIEATAFKTAGGMIGGSQISQITEHGSLKYVSRAVKNFLLGTVYLSKPIRNYFTNQTLNQESVALRVNAAIASTPFLKALTETYSKEAATAAMVELKGAVDQAFMREGKSPTPGTEGIPWNSYMPTAGSTNQNLLNLIKTRKAGASVKP